MTQQPYTPPQFLAQSYNCPHCRAFAHQTWYQLLGSEVGGQGRQSLTQQQGVFAKCGHCDRIQLWAGEKLVYPKVHQIPPPNADLRGDIQEDYNEAREILNDSPRGAAALLRLCIQKTCEQLGEKGKNINQDIASLVSKGLPQRIQQALDVVRVVGNNAVHPGQIDLKDDRTTAVKLFDLVNIIADVMITQPKEIEELYESLPDTSREAIEKRDTAEEG